MDWALLAKAGAMSVTTIVMIVAMRTGNAPVATELIIVARAVVKTFMAAIRLMNLTMRIVYCALYNAH